MNLTDELLTETYNEFKDRIDKRLNLFQQIKQRADKYELFDELIFCILTPQSRPRMAEKALTLLKENKLLYNGSFEFLLQYTSLCRFKNSKAKSIIAARTYLHEPCLFSLIKSDLSISEKRKIISKTVRGIGLKEASHFLRNTGFEPHAAILDRHILRFMNEKNLVKNEPKTLNSTLYDKLEVDLKTYSDSLSIPFDAFDFVVFYLKTGEIYK
jgi:N-glycosylase/DNA lyase